MGDTDKGHQGYKEGLQRNVGKQGAKLLRGAALLGAAAILSKLLGTLQKIPLQNVAGDTAFGIYNAVYPLYILILFAATAGFPVAVSKFVRDHALVDRRLGFCPQLFPGLGRLGVAMVRLLATGHQHTR